MNGIEKTERKNIETKNVEKKKCRRLKRSKKNTETEKAEKKMSNDENIERKNVEKLKDVVNTQLTVQMCSIVLCHPLMVFTMVVLNFFDRLS